MGHSASLPTHVAMKYGGSNMADKWQKQGHDDNLEFLEFSEFLNSKIPSSELSLFALYQKTITQNFFLCEIFTLKAKFRVPSYRYLPYTKKR